MSIYIVSRFVFNEKTLLVHYCHKYYITYVRFSYRIGLVPYMWLYQCWSSLDLKLFTDGDDITLSGNEFQLFITLLLM